MTERFARYSVRASACGAVRARRRRNVLPVPSSLRTVSGGLESGIAKLKEHSQPFGRDRALKMFHHLEDVAGVTKVPSAEDGMVRRIASDIAAEHAAPASDIECHFADVSFFTSLNPTMMLMSLLASRLPPPTSGVIPIT